MEKMLEAMSGLIADARSETKGDKSSTDGAILVAENAELRRRVEELERRAKEAAAESSMDDARVVPGRPCVGSAGPGAARARSGRSGAFGYVLRFAN